MFRKIISKLVYVLQNQLMRYQEKEADKKYQKKIKASYSKLKVKKNLTTSQIKEIQDFYCDMLGHTVPINWHQYFYSRTGIYSKLYIPTSEYKNHLIGRLNIYPFHLAYNDKNMTDVTLPHTHQPKIYLKNMGGYYYAEGKAITRDEAVNVCKDLGDVIIKPSLTGRGVGVRKVHLENGMVNGEKQSVEIF